MIRKIGILALLLLSLCGVSRAQDSGFTILLGPSVSVYYGDTKNTFAYTQDRLSWQLNGQLGYISSRGETNRGNMIGIFASGGNTNPGVLDMMKTSGADMLAVIDLDKKFNEFYTLEAGMVISRFLRLSGGMGRQFYTYQPIGSAPGETKQGKLNYFSGTLGLVFDLGAVNWVVDANLITGKDMNQNAIRLSTGFMVKF
jgi:hypothetical protein